MHKRCIDIIMISKLGVGDGGRETWIYNFLAEVGRQNRGFLFRVFSLPLAEDNIFSVTDIGNKINVEHVEIPCFKSRIPMVISFVLKFPGIYRRHRREDAIAVGVGSLGEALSVFLGTAGGHSALKKIMWLRTVYTREKFTRIPRVLMPTVKHTEKYVLRKGFDLIIGNGDDTAEYYRKIGVPCEVIHNAVRLEEYYAATRPLIGKLKVGFAGRLSPVKGIAEFLQAVEMSHKSGLLRHVEYHVAGHGPAQGQVATLHERGLLKYHGSISNRNMPDFLVNMDCCVALTKSSKGIGGGGVSNAVIEQMAASKIIIAWDNSIFRNALFESECIFVPQDNVDLLHECIRDVVGDPEKAAGKAHAARMGVMRYSIKDHVNKFFELIHA